MTQRQTDVAVTLLAIFWMLLILAVWCILPANAQTQLGPIRTPQINTQLYVGQGSFNSIQAAVTFACQPGGAAGYIVIILPGVHPVDSPTIAKGCSKTTIRDDRVSPPSFFLWNGTVYVQAQYPGTGGGGGGGGGGGATYPPGCIGATGNFLSCAGFAGTGTAPLPVASSTTYFDNNRVLAVGNTTTQPGRVTLAGDSSDNSKYTNYLDCNGPNGLLCQSDIQLASLGGMVSKGPNTTRVPNTANFDYIRNPNGDEYARMYAIGADTTHAGTVRLEGQSTDYSVIVGYLDCTHDGGCSFTHAANINGANICTSANIANGCIDAGPPTPIQGIFGGIGGVGATSSVTISGTNATLSTGDVLHQLQTTAEAAGSQWTFTNLNNQFVYLLLRSGSWTQWQDATTLQPYAMQAPITVTANGITLYLYRSTNALYGNSTPKIVQ